MSQPNQHMGVFGGGLPNGGQAHGFGAGSISMPQAGGTGLASQEAQMRFAQGAAMQQQENTNTMPRANNMSGRIREVWETNMEAEFAIIRSLVDKYPYISMVSSTSPADQMTLLT